MLIRVAGACLIVMCGSLWGISKAAVYRDKLQICDDILTIIRRTAGLIRCGCDTSEILAELKAKSDIFSDIPDDFSVTEDINEILRKAVEKSAVEGEEKNLLMRYCKELGTTDIDGQTAMLGSLAKLADELRERRRADLTKYGRLYRSVGILFGLMAGIAII